MLAFSSPYVGCQLQVTLKGVVCMIGHVKQSCIADVDMIQFSNAADTGL